MHLFWCIWCSSEDYRLNSVVRLFVRPMCFSAARIYSGAKWGPRPGHTMPCVNGERRVCQMQMCCWRDPPLPLTTAYFHWEWGGSGKIMQVKHCHFHTVTRIPSFAHKTRTRCFSTLARHIEQGRKDQTALWHLTYFIILYSDQNMWILWYVIDLKYY